MSDIDYQGHNSTVIKSGERSHAHFCKATPLTKLAEALTEINPMRSTLRKTTAFPPVHDRVVINQCGVCHVQAPCAPCYENGMALSLEQEVEVIGINQYGWWWVRATNPSNG